MAVCGPLHHIRMAIILFQEYKINQCDSFLLSFTLHTTGVYIILSHNQQYLFPVEFLLLVYVITLIFSYVQIRCFAVTIFAL